MKIYVDCKIISEANTSEHWAVAKKRKDIQKFKTKIELLKIPKKVPLPCYIKLTRIAPRVLDDDNLVISFKAVRDTLAAFILDDFRPGRADGDPRIKWMYDQRKGNVKEYAFEMEIHENLPPA